MLFMELFFHSPPQAPSFGSILVSREKILSTPPLPNAKNVQKGGLRASCTDVEKRIVATGHIENHLDKKALTPSGKSKSNFQNRKSEIESRKSKIGNRKAKIGGRLINSLTNSEIESRKSEIENRKSEIENRNFFLSRRTRRFLLPEGKI